MHQWIGSALVQIMACRLFGAKPLSEPMLAYCQLDSWEQFSVKFESEFYHFHSRKCLWICHLPTCRSFCPGGDELSQVTWQHLIRAENPVHYWDEKSRSILLCSVGITRHLEQKLIVVLSIVCSVFHKNPVHFPFILLSVYISFVPMVHNGIVLSSKHQFKQSFCMSSGVM